MVELGHYIIQSLHHSEEPPVSRGKSALLVLYFLVKLINNLVDAALQLTILYQQSLIMYVLHDAQTCTLQRPS